MENTKNIKLIIAYDGTNYYGWQKQKNRKTIQGTIEKVIRNITGENRIKLNGSGRTDAGVHAIGQVANFITKSSMPVNKWTLVLNHNLPGDIRVRKAQSVSMDFHARYSAKSKIYKYFIMNRSLFDTRFSSKVVFMRNYYYFLNKQLDIHRMIETSKYLYGYHDFSALSCLNKKKNDRRVNRLRTIKSINIKKNKQIVCFTIEADAFLYKMMRLIVGTLINFSMNKREPKEIINILEGKNNQKSGIVLPPNGLYLIKVRY
ncbi:MAG: tRNA pseudouridine(38-40) synthase TruA [Candidatus Caldatribacteriota bacterium]|nr:tRNA pseudouridine(38-40) synthase TruA [Atribacterota bacterium]MDD4288471.1 tRNA pseudouridine(38-40) synthase TruA [Atribacterota bacterium]MDD4764304.1 tRNA pseudouridine(38-40) synthase TruA [Atribacterota bacterium]MDI9597302.1 tRNA pseudouridine(38-40) synthase TruA [Atribacterota bacterium]